jgi:DNA ligase-associated metallophosphoesterase
MKVTIFGEEFEMLVQKALFWQAQEIILLADMHLGKVNHFRKAGIPVPVKANERNWESLIELVQSTKAKRIICIGDLFHSHYNYDWEMVGQFTRAFPQVSFELVTGNHDVLTDNLYERSGVTVHGERLRIGNFELHHFPVEEPNPNVYTLSGHLHPGIRLFGKGKQSMMLPCFYFGEHQGYLPAFGMFTGLSRIQPKKNDRVFVVADDSIIQIQNLQLTHEM